MRECRRARASRARPAVPSESSPAQEVRRPRRHRSSASRGSWERVSRERPDADPTIERDHDRAHPDAPLTRHLRLEIVGRRRTADARPLAHRVAAPPEDAHARHSVHSIPAARPSQEAAGAMRPPRRSDVHGPPDPSPQTRARVAWAPSAGAGARAWSVPLCSPIRRRGASSASSEAADGSYDSLDLPPSGTPRSPPPSHPKADDEMRPDRDLGRRVESVSISRSGPPADLPPHPRASVGHVLERDVDVAQTSASSSNTRSAPRSTSSVRVVDPEAIRSRHRASRGEAPAAAPSRRYPRVGSGVLTIRRAPSPAFRRRRASR